MAAVTHKQSRSHVPKIDRSDMAYVNWLLCGNARPIIPNEVALRFIEASLKRFEGRMDKTSDATGVQVRLLQRIRHEGSDLSWDMAERLVVHAGLPHLQGLLDEYAPQFGCSGWSFEADACESCGTFFHPHFARGLCTLCYGTAEALRQGYPDATNWRIDLDRGCASWDAVRCFGYDDAIFDGIVTQEQKDLWQSQGKPARVKQSLAEKLAQKRRGARERRQR